jgi:dTDP-4-dehydrorhamnose reductase
VYGKSKAEGEKLVREALPLRHCIVRTQWLFGLHGRNFVEAILRQAQEKSVLKVVNDQYGSPTYTVDLCRGLIQLAEVGGRGTFHITNSGVTTWFEFARTIVELAGLSGVKVEPMESGRLNRPAPRPSYSALDNSRFVNLAGSPLRGWQDALRAYLTERAG